MRKLLLICLLAIFLHVLTGQTWELPDVEVPVESPIKAYIYKKPVVYSADSLHLALTPYFLPKLNPALIKAEKPLPISPLRYHASLKVNTDLESNSYFVYYPQHMALSRLAIGLDWQPRTDLRSKLRAELKTSRRFSKHQLEAFASLRDADLDTFSSRYTLLGLNHYSRGSEAWSELYSRIAYAALDQTDIMDYSSRYLELQHSAKLNLLGQSGAYQVILEHGLTAVMLEYAVPIKSLSAFRPSINILTDMERVLPGFGMNFAIPLALNHSLFFLQAATIEPNSFADHLDSLPWQNLTRLPKLILKPLNMLAAWEFATKPQTMSILKRSRIELSSSYATGQGYLRAQSVSILPKQAYTDEFSTHLKLKAILESNGYKLIQDISLDLAYQEDRDWRRAAYSPLLALNSEVTRNWDQLQLAMILQQNYNQHDHLEHQLRDNIDLSLHASYKFYRDWQLKLELNRIFDSKLIQFSSLAPRGREFWLGISYSG